MSTQQLVVVPSEVPRDWLAPLWTLPELEVIVGLDLAERAGRLAEVVGLLSLLTQRVDAALLARMPALRVVANMAVGFDNIDRSALAARNVALGNTPGVLTDATADLTFALLLAAARQLPSAAADAREGRWQTWTPDGWLGVELRDSILGIVGLGKIGSAVAERARGFGMRVLYTSRSTRPPALHDARGLERCSFDELLRRADFVSLHVPATPETYHLIDAAALARMKPGAILINTARGAIVDQAALCSALQSGHLRAAALDVTDPEPLPPNHTLFQLRNCLVLPHIGSATERTRRAMADLACRNLIAGVRGTTLPHPVPFGADAPGSTDRRE